ncbi:Acyl carrier protein, mitochondrial [Exophiala mesophila]|uniref:Acyl carrier protein n=1 Tax=Exophiala mesophila TaxID=212818 RepID=A0A0D1ZP98_EXOME|nr:acyl carrier protein [Exophiala mesophila]KIV96427.1 acyl carrier protein [Exophiala mesophila]RVX75471.1 Acyl carrier protein, mitochondrial [Exophiala mesophila]
MLRTGAVRAFYAATRTQIPRQLPAFRAQISYPLQHASRSIPSFVVPSVRCYSASAGLTKDEVQGRIFDVLKNFDKVSDVSKITGTSHFQNDLGLDSLDTVEVVMAIEEEFSIEIPDKEADAIHSVDQAVTYIVAQPDAH